jgi:hypothetical protein
VSIEIGKFIKGKNESSSRRDPEWVAREVTWSEVFIYFLKLYAN